MKHNLTKFLTLSTISLSSICTLPAQASKIDLLPMIEGIPMGGDDPFEERLNPAANFAHLNDKLKAEAEAIQKLSPKDKIRLQHLSKTIVYRNVSSIMTAQAALSQKDKIQKPPAPKPLDTSKTPANPTQAKQVKAKHDMLVHRYEVQQEISQLRSDITLGNWDAVKTYFSTLPDVIAQRTYSILTKGLCTTAQIKPILALTKEGTRSHRQKPVMLVSDVIAWIDLSKTPPNTRDIQTLAQLITFEGELPKSFYQTLKKGTRYLGGPEMENKLRAAELLLSAKRPLPAQQFLLAKEDAMKTNNYKALDLLATFHQMLRKDEPFQGHLQQAWEINRTLFDLKNLPPELAERAMLRGFKLLPMLEDKTKGSEWFRATLKAGKDRGTNLLAYVGNVASQSQGNRNESYRLDKMQLQHATALALISSSNDGLSEWKTIFMLYAKNWLHEAEFTFRKDKSTTSGPSMNRDSFGNVYYANNRFDYNTGNRNSNNENRPIKASDILAIGPSKKWLAQLDELTKLQCLKNYARLNLKLKNDELAFDYIQGIAKINQQESKRFISELITVWADNHDPNAAKSYRNSWYYSYGYNQRADSIPLTRSKQQRNLQELKALVIRLRDIGISQEDEVALAKAFIRCHSQAEIWRMDVFEEIFGDSKTLSPETITAVISSMRASLVSVWPDPKLQKKAKTKRTDIELQQEVVNGYTSALFLTDAMIQQHPKDWNIQLQQAALQYGRNEYLTLIGKNTNAGKKKSDALKLYAIAAEKYKKIFSTKRANIRRDVYENWFYAALGSADLPTLKAHHLQSPKEFNKIKASIESLPPAISKRQMDAFANSLATRISGVSPDLKLRYLKAGLSIVGDNKRAEEAHKLSNYYKDLVQELQVVTKIDGSDEVNHELPFGITVYLRHTKEIEREAGGFSKYLQNQSANGGYNYGRPTEDYRDKFSEKSMAVLDEHFDVKSITFHKEDVESYTDAEHGWRVTPYAYIVLQTKGEQVDKIPSLQIDFDFMDTSGYVVIPISSAEIPIATNTEAAPRPMQDLSISQIYDDRLLEKEQKILLEVRADAHGIIPPVEDLIDLGSLTDFEIEKIDDKGSLVSTLDPATTDSPAISERYAVIHLKPKSDTMPSSFTFPTPLTGVTVKEKDGLSTQRYDDVDLVNVTSTIDLLPSKNLSGTTWIIIGLITAFIIAAVLYLLSSNKKKAALNSEPEHEFTIPENLTPVNALHLLDLIKTKRQQTGKLDDQQQLALDGDMNNIMQNHFGKSNPEEGNAGLMETIKKWL
ncbi:MAG: hypothetical protein ACI9E1_000409 [Cryomorphaceae bacterium]|jgi:hypothetical protein